MRHLAVIPARGGSKRIPRKNIRPFLGKPVIAYSVEAALACGKYDLVMVSTDDAEIADVARSFGAEVPFMRSERTSDDFATTADVLEEVLGRLEQQGESFDTISCIYSTAPFLTPETIADAFEMMEASGFDSVFTAVQYSYPIQRSLKISGQGRIAMNWPEYRNSRSQDLEPAYHDAGQFYLARVPFFLREKTLWGDNTGGLVLPETCVQDLDTETDWAIAEMKYALAHGTGL